MPAHTMKRIATLLTLISLSFSAPAQDQPVGQMFGPVPVQNIIDGDTVVLWSNLGPRTVRLIGIDAPELDARDPHGHAAAEHLRRLLPAGSSVWVETDLALEDIYGRLLAYLYVEDPEGSWQLGPHTLTQLNLRMVEAGWARTMEIAPNTTYSDLFHTAEQTAAAGAAAGIWAASPVTAVAMPGGPISIACVLFNPSAPNDENAEIVWLNLSEDMDTRGYWLFDEGSGVRLQLPVGVQPAGELQVRNPGQGIWNNSGDTIYLMLGNSLIDAWEYSGGGLPEDSILCRDGTVRQ